MTRPGGPPLRRQRQRHAPARSVLEATGGLERLVASTLGAAGLPVAGVNPRQVRDFAKATGPLAKTEALAAQVLAPFAATVRPPVRPLPDTQTAELAALLPRWRQVVQQLPAERHRLARTALRRVRQRIQAHVRWLQRELTRVDGDRDAALPASPLWRAQEALRRPVPGVGRVLTRTLLAERPELGTLSRQQAAPGPGRAVHGDADRHALQSGRANVLPTALRGGQSEAGGPGGLHAEAADDPECAAARPAALAAPGGQGNRS